MGILNVQFYSTVARTRFGIATNHMKEPNLSSGDVTTSAVSAQSVAAPSKSKFARVTVDSASYIAVGADPTAIVGDILMPANSSMVLGVIATDKVAARTVA